MFVKLAIMNVRRQLRNYLIYFITVSLSVAMLFAVNSLSFSEQVLRLAEMSNDMEFMFRMVTILAAIVTAFVLSYAASFMLKLRKKEFGMYLTLGMARKDIRILYFCETGLLTAFASVTGMAAGMVIYQLLSALFSYIMDVPFEASVCSAKGILLTIFISIGMFLLSVIVSLRYLKKTTLSDLLKAEPAERSEKHPVLWCCLSLLSIFGLVFCFVMTYRSLMAAFHNESVRIFLWLVLDLSMIFLSHAALSRGVTTMLLKWKNVKNKETNTVIFRSLSGRMTMNALLIGVLAALLTFAVVMANISFGEKVYSDQTIIKDCPYDVMAMYDLGETQGISKEEGRRIIESFSPVTGQTEYALYSAGKTTLSSHVEGWKEMEQADKFMPLSMFNGLLTDCGYEPVSLKNGYILVTTEQQICDTDFSDASVMLGDRAYYWKGSSMAYPDFTDEWFYFVVPDEALDGMVATDSCIGYTLKNHRPDALAMMDKLTYVKETKDGREEICDYRIQEECRLYMSSVAGTLIIGTLYIATVFVCLALAVLSLKTLSSMEEERRRFAVLFRLGADCRLQKKTLFRQIGSFFMAPFALPMILTVPLGVVFGEVYNIWGFAASDAGGAMETAVLISSVVALVWILYLAVTYRIACDNVICCGNEKRAQG